MFNYYIFLFYWIAVIIGAHYLLNLTIAVLGTEFENAQKLIKEEEMNPKNPKKYESFDIKKLQSLGLFHSNKIKKSSRIESI